MSELRDGRMNMHRSLQDPLLKGCQGLNNCPGRFLSTSNDAADSGCKSNLEKRDELSRKSCSFGICQFALAHARHHPNYVA